MKRGENPEVLAGAKKEAEAKRAAGASKSGKTFYKVTVKVLVISNPPIAPGNGSCTCVFLWTLGICIATHASALVLLQLLFFSQDNGTGMPHKDIPNLLGRVLSGTKYGLKQTRGKFGLGAKMALIWSKMSTGLPIEVWSARHGQSFISYYKLDIDIHK